MSWQPFILSRSNLNLSTDYRYADVQKKSGIPQKHYFCALWRQEFVNSIKQSFSLMIFFKGGLVSGGRFFFFSCSIIFLFQQKYEDRLKILAFPTSHFRITENGANYTEVMNIMYYVRPGTLKISPKETFFIYIKMKLTSICKVSIFFDLLFYKFNPRTLF